MSIPTRKSDDTAVSAIGYGAMPGYGQSTQPLDERLAWNVSIWCVQSLPLQFSGFILQFSDAVLARGRTFWDTADVYYDSEEVLVCPGQLYSNLAQVDWYTTLQRNY